MNRLKLFYRKSRVALLLCLVLLSMSLSGCITKTKIEYLYPPQAFLVQCERSEFSGTTYGDAIEYLVKVMGERDLCAGQIDSIREWQARTKQGFK
ncbi:Rz1-like lysis system protein LysC [Glaesserella parasuis]|uniref:Rz1-like lysis system protein LysC n=1 Tax=Glaesserella parasuis TaxID=738 RepID=UPI003F698F11